MRYTGVKVRVNAVNRVGGMKNVRKGTLLVTLGFEEAGFEIIGKKKLLKEFSIEILTNKARKRKG